MTVKGVGPVPARILLLGESPGRSEEIKGIPFVGRAGEQLNQALSKAVLMRADCYITNVMEERLVDKNGKDRPPTEEEVGQIRARKESEIRRVAPEFIIALGATASRFLMPMYDEVGGLETLNGRGFRGLWSKAGDRARVVIPVYHPAAGLHDSRKLTDFFWGMKMAGRTIRGQEEVTTINGPLKIASLPPLMSDVPPARDSEWTDKALWCWTGYDHTPSSPKGWAPADRSIFSQDFTDPRLLKPSIWHNALADLHKMHAASIPAKACDDTMVALYQLGTEPLGLKEAAFRYTGRVGKDYNQTIEAKDRERLGEYFGRVHGELWPQPEGRKKPVTKRIETIEKKIEEKGAKEARKAWKDHDMKELVEARLGPLPTTNLSHLPLAEAKAYALKDPLLTAELHIHLRPKIESQGLTSAYKTDIAIIPMLARMQHIGLPVNLSKVNLLKPLLESEAEALSQRAKLIYGSDFNIASADQVRDALEADGTVIDKRTPKGQMSTSKEALRAIRADSEIADLALEYRERAKNLSTFVPALLEFTQADGRIHPNIRTTNTETGRLSCHDPNLLAFPARTKLGQAVRDCFEAPVGWVFCNADYDQIEMKLMAHESQDATMIEAVKQEDMHAWNAARMFKLPIAEVKKGGPKEKSHRTPIKSVGFLVLYRGGASKLREQMAAEGVKESREYWQAMIDGFYSLFPGVRRFQHKCDSEADVHGFIRDMWGRIRHIEGVWSTDPMLVLKCQRECGNFPIQSGAQGLIKRGMIKVWHELQKPMWRGKVEPVLQVHDELVFLALESVAKAWCERVKELLLADQHLFTVPLGSSSGISKTWGGLK